MPFRLQVHSDTSEHTFNVLQAQGYSPQRHYGDKTVISAADLVQEHIKLDDFIDSENKKFADHLKPHKKRQEEIRNLLLSLLNEQKTNSMSTDHGTAYISTIMTPKINDRDKYLDFVNENWDDIGNEMLQLSAPQKDALKNFIETHDNKTPPGVEVSYFNRLNIRRS